jgi:hypothetical protein
MMADHGHNLTASKSASASLERELKNAGFHVRSSINSNRDVVIELAALVNYVGIRTRQAQRVADACVQAPEVEFATYLEDSSIIIRDSRGAAAIEQRDGAFRYRVIDRDVLSYTSVIEQLRAAGKLSTDGWAADRDWFDATIDHQYPDGPRRLWDAFHGLVVSAPDVMVTLKPGYHAGEQQLERWITMKSTHGSLDRANSLTFLMTMNGKTHPPVIRGGDVMELIEPGFVTRSAREGK